MLPDLLKSAAEGSFWTSKLGFSGWGKRIFWDSSSPTSLLHKNKGKETQEEGKGKQREGGGKLRKGGGKLDDEEETQKGEGGEDEGESSNPTPKLLDSSSNITSLLSSFGLSGISPNTSKSGDDYAFSDGVVGGEKSFGTLHCLQYDGISQYYFPSGTKK